MANFTAKDVATLREMSGAGMMDCKKALVECDGDMEKAMDYLRVKSLAASAKKAARIAAEGIVERFVEGNIGVLVEVNCETDFVAKTDDFKNLVLDIAAQIAKTAPACVDSLMEQKYFKDESKTIAELLNESVARIGEKITVRRFVRYELTAGELVDSYIHLGGKIGVLIQAKATEEHRTTLHDIALHIAAFKPTYLDKSEVATEELDKEREILRAQALAEENPKPLPIIDKMVEGRIAKYYKEVCLLEQAFVKDPDTTVGNLIKGKFEIKRFECYEMGKGLQKREDNFAEEVMSQIK